MEEGGREARGLMPLKSDAIPHVCLMSQTLRSHITAFEDTINNLNSFYMILDGSWWGNEINDEHKDEIGA